MNYLAHLFLSGDDPEVRLGNFIGDFVRGRTPENFFPKKIAIGIHLHRMIDAFTDSHPIVRESKIRLRPSYRHYSGVIVDVFYDHFLARNWEKYHAQPLNDFAQGFYQFAKSEEKWLPEKAKYVLPFMVRHNWLTNYSSTEGIDRVLTGMSKSTPYTSGMEKATSDLIRHYESFEREFLQFMPELHEASNNSHEKLYHQLTGQISIRDINLQP